MTGGADFETKKRIANKAIRALRKEFGSSNVYWNSYDNCLSMKTEDGIYNLRLSKDRYQIDRRDGTRPVKLDKFV
jgi:hypothetical protein